MTKTKSTKRALLLSALSLLMCVSMLVGSTFAWFTDEAKTAGNIIQTGKLDVVLEKYTGQAPTGWENVEGQVLNFQTHANSTVAAENILWEPGCTYVLEHVRVRNAGNLALKFEIALANATGDTELLNVLEFTYTQFDGNNNVIAAGTFDYIKGELIPGASTGSIMIAAHMKEDAGNEYQNKKIEGVGLVVTAQQLPYEYDTLGNQYDALIEALNGVVITDGSRTQIGVEVAQITGITSVDSFYVEIYDQNGDVMTKIVPTQKYINSVVDGVIKETTACAVIGEGDSSSWDNSPAIVPTADKYPAKATVFVNGVEKGSTTSFIYGGTLTSWQDVVDGYNASVTP